MPRLRWIFLIIAFSLVSVILGTIFWFEARQVLSHHSLITQRTKELDEKRENIQRYREQIAYYQTPEGMAHLGREQYNFVFEGEKIYLIEQ